MGSEIIEQCAPAGAEPDSEQLLKRLRAGEPAAFGELVGQHGDWMLGAIRRIVGNEDDALDAFQNALASAHRAIGGFEGSARLSTWLHRIAVNAALMNLRTSRRARDRERRSLVPSELVPELRGHAPHPGEPSDRPLLRDEARSLVRSSIEALPHTHREILHLRHIEELGTGETADRLEISRNAVKVRLHRARRALRSYIEERWPHYATAV